MYGVLADTDSISPVARIRELDIGAASIEFVGGGAGPVSPGQDFLNTHARSSRRGQVCVRSVPSAQRNKVGR
jgi:hypothetical protein